jgi:hypothetical protein
LKIKVEKINKMKSLMYCLISGMIIFISCGPAPQSGGQDQSRDVLSAVLSEPEAGFLNNLASLCGKSFRGRETYMAPGRESWAEKDFVMHVVFCADDRVHIPFHLDEDQSRTWMFLVEDGRLRFRHDHRHTDGTPEDLTLYGGFSDGSGTGYAQYFPADQYTVDLLVDTLDRQWNIVMDEDLTNFSYQLQYKGELIFQADFDLTNPI